MNAHQSKPDLFHWPQLSARDFGFIRSPGAGLGNLLFPVGRALIGQAAHGGQFVYPTMRQLKLGTFLRSERDKRTYGDVLRPRSAADWQTWLAAARRHRVSEAGFDGRNHDACVVYRGLGGCFHDLAAHRRILAAWIEANSRKAGNIAEPYDIGIHVRISDFAPPDPARGGLFSTRHPMEWYRAAFDEGRRLLGITNPRTVLFTDIDVAPVAAALRLADLIYDPSKNAMTAIANLSKARLIITSRSTFSMWGAFLGNAPAVWDKAFDLTATFPEREGLDIRV